MAQSPENCAFLMHLQAEVGCFGTPILQMADNWR
jgi:hypothetical protein